jgi:hypothetical protein
MCEYAINVQEICNKYPPPNASNMHELVNYINLYAKQMREYAINMQ